MIRVQNVILSEDIATAKFACDISRCKGACCVVGDAGAPVSKKEIPVLRKAFRKLRDNLDPEAVNVVKENGVVQGDSRNGYEISCIESGECVFVQKDENGAATCAIQNAYYSGEFGWEKPISCHLYPIRLKRIAGLEYANFEYLPELCSAGCDRGESEGIYLSDFLKDSLIRRYGEEWYMEFLDICEEERKQIA
ncbi:DUF3109 family protein [Rhodohalobacter sulfatireducens]|uniref:DUF3109 family protein n=1 Tax=Rhodohalobacter sulfatireducens TaxID=2911366 RepID=A0ABS9KIM8_9BACT|nr:DUF3109 family protein [Rhodohalobacter sulfatireducens]MCG2590703.1 DUF3109 family protein [Rhodohalobacter sulfatireducens]